MSWPRQAFIENADVEEKEVYYPGYELKDEELIRPSLIRECVFDAEKGVTESDDAQALVITAVFSFMTEWANYAACSLLVCVPVVVLFLVLNR